jgi:hypothetical protein
MSAEIREPHELSRVGGNIAALRGSASPLLMRLANGQNRNAVPLLFGGPALSRSHRINLHDDVYLSPGAYRIFLANRLDPASPTATRQGEPHILAVCRVHRDSCEP